MVEIREELRKQIALKLIEADPSLLTLERLDTLIEEIEKEYDNVRYSAFLDLRDAESDGDWPFDIFDQ
jgi:hypothetical protein